MLLKLVQIHWDTFDLVQTDSSLPFLCSHSFVMPVDHNAPNELSANVFEPSSIQTCSMASFLEFHHMTRPGISILYTDFSGVGVPLQHAHNM